MTDLTNRLCAAVEQGNTEEAYELLLQGADINAHNTHGDAPLHYAAAKGQTEAVKFLVRHGARMSERGAHGMTALHVAAKNNGANVDLRDDDNKTPMQVASFFKSTFWKMCRALEERNLS